MLISKDPFFNNYLNFFDSKNDYKIMNTDIIENENLNVKVIKNDESTDNNYLKKEIFYGEYSRKFYIGNVNEEEISANYNNGILTICIPKESKIENKKNIEIK